MANPSLVNSQPDRNQQTEGQAEDQQQSRCVCQGHFDHDEHQKEPLTFSPVAQQMAQVGFSYIAMVYALGFGLCGIGAMVASIQALHIAANNNLLSIIANQLALLQTCLTNSACPSEVSSCIFALMGCAPDV